MVYHDAFNGLLMAFNDAFNGLLMVFNGAKKHSHGKINE